jgi:hypothetical protein
LKHFLRFRNQLSINFKSFAILTLLIIITAQILMTGIRKEGDSIALVQSSQALFECAKNGTFYGCQGANQFGVPQHFIAMALIVLNVSSDQILSILGILNLICFIFINILLWRNLKGRQRMLGLVVLLSGPVIVYAGSTFSEMLQCFLFILFVFGVKNSWRKTTLISGFLAATTKESAIIVLLIVALVLVFHENRKLNRDFLIRTTASVSGLFIGFAGISGFNMWKFGSFKNAIYSDPQLFTHNFRTVTNSLFGIWFAPGGGLVIFWPIAACLIVGVPLFALKGISNKKVFLSLGVLSAVASTSLMLATWFSPFGWVAWGPRLLMPTAFMLAIVVILTFEVELQIILDWLSVKSFYSQCIKTAIIISSLASYGVLTNNRAYDKFFAGDGICPEPFIIQGDKRYFYECLSHYMWKLHPSLFSTGLGGFSLISIFPVLIVIYLVNLLFDTDVRNQEI